MKIDKYKITIITLAVALFFIVQYIMFDKFSEQSQQDILNAYQDGYEVGVSEAVSAIYRQTENCQTSYIEIGNLTREIFDITCIEKINSSP